MTDGKVKLDVGRCPAPSGSGGASSSVRATPRARGRARPILALVALAFGAGGLEGQVPGPAEGLRLGAGDAVRLTVEDEPDLSAEFPVASDGRALFPLIGSVPVAGRDFEDVAGEIRAGLAAQLAAGVEVQVTPVYRLAVLGEVRAPGLLAVDPTIGIAEALAMAGGFLPSADLDRIQVVRDGRVVAELSEESLAEAQPPLRPGDRVVVGRRGWFRENLGIVIGTAGSLAVAIITGLIVR